MQTTLEFIGLHKKLLEDLFGKDWFFDRSVRRHRHPAFLNWHFCCEMIERNAAFDYPANAHQFRNLLSLLLNSYLIVECSGGTLTDFSLGNFAEFGDKAVQKRIGSIIHDPKQYASLMTELTFAAWCKSKKFDLVPFADESYPDFRLTIPGASLPIIAECKKIEAGTRNNRYRKILNKANRQVKYINETCYGIVVVDLTEKVETDISTLSDAIPEAVDEVAEQFARLLAKCNSSISAAMLLWDDFYVSGQQPDAAWLTAVVRRRAHIVEHRNPISRIPPGLPLCEFGSTTMFRIRRSGVEVGQKSINRLSPCPCGSGLRFKHCHGKVA